MEAEDFKLCCLIIDDETPAQRILEKFTGDIPMLNLVGKCNNVFEALSFLQNQKIDLLFLDINMPKMNGMDFLRTLKNPPSVIITTAYREYALEGFELNVIDYLHKPFSFERFLTAVNKALDKHLSKNLQYTTPSKVNNSSESEFMFVKEDKIDYKIKISEIQFLESVGDYVKVHTLPRTYIVYQTLKYFENFLIIHNFIRVHKSFLIPISKIDSIEGNMIRIGKDIIPIGSTFRKPFFEKIERYKSS